MERGVCDIYVARACADARHTNDTHALIPSNHFVCCVKIKASLRHRRVILLVTEKKTYPPFRSPRGEVPEIWSYELSYEKRSEYFPDIFPEICGSKNLRDKFPRRRFCTSGTRI